MEPVFFGIFFWLASVYASSILYNRALRKLSTEKKAELIDKFSHLRSYGLLIMLAIIGAFFIALQKELFDRSILTVCYLSTFVIYLISINFYSYRVFKRNDFPRDFIREYIMTALIRFTGFIVLFSFLMNQT